MRSHDRAPPDRPRRPQARPSKSVTRPVAGGARVQVQLSPDVARPANTLALQRAVGNRAVGKLLQSQRGVASNPTGLPGGLRGGLERLSGQDLSGVRVHANSPEPARIGALATTQGQDIHLGPGQEKHLPHEGWHAVQQLQGRVRQTTQAKGAPVNDGALGGTRGAAVLQAKFAVQVEMEMRSGPDDTEEKALKPSDSDPPPEPEQSLVNKVHVADRPPGLFDPAEKSHTTAWVVYTDQLRNGILGRTVPDAILAVHALYVDAQKLPGVARVGLLPKGPRRIYDNAKKAMDTLVEDSPTGLSRIGEADLLQKLGAGFLSYRNAIPLSQVDLGGAIGQGEPEILKTLRPINDLRKGWVPHASDTHGLQLEDGGAGRIRAAMWSLLDAGAMKSLDEPTPDNTKAPGTGGDSGPAQRIADAIVQHLWTLESTYTTAFRAAEMDGDASIEAYVKQLGHDGDSAKPILAAIQRHYASGSDNTFQESEARLNTAGPADQGNFSVQIRIKPNETVSEISVGGRPPTLLGTSQGSHTTAWIVYVQSVHNQVVGQTISTATKNVTTLITYAKNLPGMKRVGNLTEQQLYWHEVALRDVTKALSNAEKSRSTDDGLPALQQLVKAYLFLRNAVPLSQVKGGPANANSEGLSRAYLGYLESDFTQWTRKDSAPSKSSMTPYRQAFWELYDYKQMMKAANHALEPDDAPGLGKEDDGDVFMADSIEQHLLAMALAFPTVCARLHPRSKKVLDVLLIDKLELSDKRVSAIVELVLEKKDKEEEDSKLVPESSESERATTKRPFKLPEEDEETRLGSEPSERRRATLKRPFRPPEEEKEPDPDRRLPPKILVPPTKKGTEASKSLPPLFKDGKRVND